MRYAGLRIRFAAMFTDGVIVLLVYFAAWALLGFVAGFITGITGGGDLDTSPNSRSGFILNLVTALVALGFSSAYFTYNWARGSTIGLRRYRLRGVDARTGAPIGIGRAIIRWLGFIVSLIPLYGGLIWAAFDARKQGWHDKLANSVVVSV